MRIKDGERVEVLLEDGSIISCRLLSNRTLGPQCKVQFDITTTDLTYEPAIQWTECTQDKAIEALELGRHVQALDLDLTKAWRSVWWNGTCMYWACSSTHVPIIKNRRWRRNNEGNDHSLHM